MTAAPSVEETRATVLARIAGARAAVAELSTFLDRAHGAYGHRLTAHLDFHQRTLAGARARYLELLPRVLLARCPFTGVEVRHSLDTLGLDGPWWDYERPLRPATEDVPPAWLAMTGAVALAPAVEATPFLVRPGPGAPAVLPRLLQHEAVRAVVSQVAIGRHTGFAVTYFAEGAPAVLPVDTWGANEYRTGGLGAPLPVSDGAFDFDLGPWIERGRLRWIAPGDPAATLRDTVADCPYLRLDGPRETQHIQDGVVWTASTIDRARSEP